MTGRGKEEGRREREGDGKRWAQGAGGRKDGNSQGNPLGGRCLVRSSLIPHLTWNPWLDRQRHLQAQPCSPKTRCEPQVPEPFKSSLPPTPGGLHTLGPRTSTESRGPASPSGGGARPLTTELLCRCSCHRHFTRVKGPRVCPAACPRSRHRASTFILTLGPCSNNLSTIPGDWRPPAPSTCPRPSFTWRQVLLASVYYASWTASTFKRLASLLIPTTAPSGGLRNG